jgi:DNA-binding protein
MEHYELTPHQSAIPHMIIDPHKVIIQRHAKIQKVIDRILKILTENSTNTCTLHAQGQAITKCISICEVTKRRWIELQQQQQSGVAQTKISQQTQISRELVGEDEWRPKASSSSSLQHHQQQQTNMDKIIVRKYQPAITIYLSLVQPQQ